MNISELAAFLPRDVANDRIRGQLACRVPGNKSNEPDTILWGFSRSAIRPAARKGRTVVVALDRTKISDNFECPAVFSRVGDWAVLPALRMEETKGGMGLDGQKPLLDDLAGMTPDGVGILPVADRLCGYPKLIRHCLEKSWQYRVRLKGDPILSHYGRELAVGDLPVLVPVGVEDADFCGSGIKTSIGALHGERHGEPWFIAMKGRPTPERIPDCGMRWGLEALFSGWKARGSLFS